MVSHDRALIDRLVDKLIILDHGRAEVHLGNYSHYRWKRAEEAAPEASNKAEDVLKIRRGKKPVRGKEEQKVLRKRRNQLEELERDIAEVEELVNGIEARFTEIDPSDYETARQLKEEYDGLKRDLGDMYAEWERLAEEMTE
ncbi:MAG: hypothetical protein IT365_10725 [Candidatus Hydrogenedentes bacterium]|nr:hypothetical protein [Candidatus Hydrogenedentota bacterium]